MVLAGLWLPYLEHSDRPQIRQFMEQIGKGHIQMQNRRDRREFAEYAENYPQLFSGPPQRPLRLGCPAIYFRAAWSFSS
jgi:hypothetical protein